MFLVTGKHPSPLFRIGQGFYSHVPGNWKTSLVPLQVWAGPINLFWQLENIPRPSSGLGRASILMFLATGKQPSPLFRFWQGFYPHVPGNWKTSLVRFGQVFYPPVPGNRKTSLAPHQVWARLLATGKHP
jgi:hypothetical protein